MRHDAARWVAQVSMSCSWPAHPGRWCALCGVNQGTRADLISASLCFFSRSHWACSLLTSFLLISTLPFLFPPLFFLDFPLCPCHWSMTFMRQNTLDMLGADRGGWADEGWRAYNSSQPQAATRDESFAHVLEAASCEMR